MKFEELSIPGILLVKPTIMEDHRGYFMESYHIDKFNIGGIGCKFLQDNHVKSVKNILRGLHFQVKFPQAKLLRCTNGKIFDVAVDVRNNSPSFGKWVGVELSEDNKYQLFVPEGFAHGYYVMSETAEIIYKCSDIYHHDDESGIKWDSPDIGIKWPCVQPILSEKDEKLQDLRLNK